MSAAQPIFVSLLIDRFGEGARVNGHPYPYCIAAGQAATLAGWEHRAAVPTTCPIQPLPANWTACMGSINQSLHDGRRFGQLQDIQTISQQITTYLHRQVLPEKRPFILFVQNCQIKVLYALCIALFRTPRVHCNLWLLYHHLSAGQRRSVQFRWLLKLLNARFQPVHFKLLTDTEVFALDLSTHLSLPVSVVPNVYTSADSPQSTVSNPPAPELAGKIICWWPGRPRPEKGLEQIQALARCVSPDARRLCLALSGSAHMPPTPGACQVIELDDELSPDEYRQWMRTAQLILLPYDPQRYAQRSSGVFIEAITAGTPTLVSTGTWMAGELARYDLHELILDWDHADVPATIVRLAADEDIRRRLKVMQIDYMNRLGEAAFARALVNLYQGAPLSS